VFSRYGVPFLHGKTETGATLPKTGFCFPKSWRTAARNLKHAGVLPLIIQKPYRSTFQGGTLLFYCSILAISATFSVFAIFITWSWE
jgi:hypothetical protein